MNGLTVNLGAVVSTALRGLLLFGLAAAGATLGAQQAQQRIGQRLGHRQCPAGAYGDARGRSDLGLVRRIVHANVDHDRRQQRLALPRRR